MQQTPQSQSSATSWFKSLPEFIVGVLWILSGFLLAFFGKFALKPALSFAGFLAGMFLAVVLVNAFNKISPLGDSIQWAYFVVGLILGIVVAYFSWKLLKLGFSLVGGAAGCIIGTFVCALIPPIQTSRLYSLLLIIGFGVLGLILGCMATDAIILVATSIIGPILMFFGLDIYVKTGFDTWLMNLLRLESQISPLGSSAKWMVLGTAVTIVFAFSTQLCIASRPKRPAPNKRTAS